MGELFQSREFLSEEEERKALAARKGRRNGPESVAVQEVGRIGEKLACRYLWRRGFRIVERNYKGPRGEIDVIAERRGRIHFVEVKTRTSASLGAPEERVDREKRALQRETARAFLQKFHDAPQGGTQFDVLAQVIDSRGKAKQTLFEDAF